MLFIPVWEAQLMRALICEGFCDLMYQRAWDTAPSFTPWVQGAPLLRQLPPALPFLMLCGTSCSLLLQNSSDPAAVSAAAPLGSTSLEELQQQTQMPGFGDKQPANSQFPYNVQKREEKKDTILGIPNEPG